MIQIRRGNSIQITWVLNFKNEEDANGLQDSQKRLYLVDSLKNKYEVTDFSVDNNVITFTWYGSHQNNAKNGKYSLLLLIDYGTHNQKIIDKTGVFILVEPLDGKTASGNSDEGVSIETIELLSEVGIGNINVDLSNYYTKSEINTMFASVAQQQAEDTEAMNEKHNRFSHTIGRGLTTYNISETAVGQYNISHKNQENFSSGGNTLFSIGNGTSDNFRKNAIEVMQNGDIYFRIDDDLIKLQDIITVDYTSGHKVFKFVGQATDYDTSDLVSEEEIEGMDLAKKQWVIQQIVDYVTSGQIDMELYVSREELGAYNFAYKTDIINISDLLRTSYVTKDEISNLVSQDDLSSFAYASLDDISSLVSYTYLHNKKYVSSDDLAAQGYITSRSLPDLSSYVKTAYITTYYYDKNETNSLILDKIRDSFIEKDIIFKASAAYTITTNDIDRWNTPVNLSSYATKEYVNEKLESIPSPDMSPYVTHNQLSRASYITQHQDLSSYATITYVNDKISGINIPDLTPYATKQEISQAGYLQTHQSLAGYATEAYVNNKISQIPHTDLSSYVTYTYLETRLDNIVTDEADPVFTASPAHSITNENLAVLDKLQYSNMFKKIEFNSETDSNDGFLATENYVLDQISQQSNIVVKLTRSQFDFLVSQGLVDEHKIYMITDENDNVVHNDELNNYATKLYVGNELSYYYTKTEVNALIANAGSGGTIDLTGYATETWVQEYISSLNLANKAYAQTQAKQALQTAKNYADTVASNGIDLTDYALKSYVTGKLINYATVNDIPDISGLAQKTWVNSNFATKGDLQNIDYNNIDLSAYVSRTALSQMGYITQHQSLAGYATEAYVNNKVNNINLSDYVSKTQLSQAGYITSHQSLDDYATKAYVLEKVSGTDNIDLSNYVSKTELSSMGYLQSHQSLYNYATKDYVIEKINEIDIPENVNLSNYATKAYVQNKIDAIVIPEAPDLSNYATKTYVENKFNSINIPDLTPYATKTYVNAQIAAMSGGSGNIIWTGTQAQYDALQDKTVYQIYLIKQ